MKNARITVKPSAFDPEFIEPATNTYVLTVVLNNVKKAEALKIAEATRSICGHENVGSEVAVSHVKYVS
jgi:hypothetical protein